MEPTLLIRFLSDQPGALIAVGALLGLLVGSFLNVVILRLPRILDAEWRRDCHALLNPDAEPEPGKRLSLVWPPSHCPLCDHRILPWENIPVLSYLWLRGKCSRCGARISPRYPLVELATGIVSAIVVARFGFTVATASALMLSWALIALSVIDFDHQLLPDVITLPFLWLGLLLSLAGTFTNPVDAIIGAAAGYLSLWSVFHLFRLLTGKEGMGYGDFKLLGLFGAWLGWQSLPMIILLSSVVGAVFGLAMIAFRGRDRNLPMPFGPYLAVAGWLSLLWREEISGLYLRAVGLN